MFHPVGVTMKRACRVPVNADVRTRADFVPECTGCSPELVRANDLVETSKEREKGFRAAAEDTKNSELQKVFLRRAQDCAWSAADLQKLVAQHCGSPEKGGSVAGTAHRGWLDLKAAV